MKKIIFIALMLSAIVVIFFVLVRNVRTPSDPEKILDRIRNQYHEIYEEQLRAAGFSDKPKYVSLRIYKKERVLEIWAGTDNKKKLKILASYDICAMDFEPGPKLREGDKRTPEGSFALSSHYLSKNWFMWINLSSPRMSKLPGIPGIGDSFYFCTDYPTPFHRARSARIDIHTPGSAICIHGNCVSSGCPSLKNQDFIDVYYLTQFHDTARFGPPRVHILPFRFYEKCKAPKSDRICLAELDLRLEAGKAAALNKDSENLGAKEIEKLWRHMQKREYRFLSRSTPDNAELKLEEIGQ